MWPFKRLVKCVDCGYLINGDYGTKPRCHRNQEIYSVTIEQSNDGKCATGVIGSPSDLRLCRSYQKKIEGLTPAGHLEHQLYKGPGVSLSKWALVISMIALLKSFGPQVVSMLKYVLRK